MRFVYFNKQKKKQTNKQKTKIENQKFYSILPLFYRKEKEDNDRKVRDFKYKYSIFYLKLLKTYITYILVWLN